MRFRLIGDHTDYHCGCAAVSQALTKRLAQSGTIVGDPEDYDILVVNGEGSMHHDSRSYRNKIKAIEAAQAEGKRTWLVNTVWQDNGPQYDYVLHRLDGIVLRGVASARDLKSHHGITGKLGLDLSYYADVADEGPETDFNGETITTDIYSQDFGQFAWLNGNPLKGLPRLDLTKVSWSQAVQQIKTAKVIVTGRHHAMYAACRARIPFIPIESNSHKFADLLEWAQTTIPLVRRVWDVRHALNWVEKNQGIYERLFDWMDKARPWETLDEIKDLPSFDTRAHDGRLKRAVAAMHLTDWSEAARLFEAARPSNDSSLSLQQHSRALAAQSDHIGAATLLAQGRWAYPEMMAEYHSLTRLVDLHVKTAGASRVTWLDLCQKAATAWREGDADMCRAVSHQALKIAGADYPLAHFVLMRRLTTEMSYDVAREIARLADGRSSQVRSWDEFRINVSQGAAPKDAVTYLKRLKATKFGKSVAFKQVYYRHLWLTEGADTALLNQISADKDTLSTPNLYLMACGIAAECHDVMALGDLIRRTPDNVRFHAISLPAADWLSKHADALLIPTEVMHEIEEKSALYAKLQANTAAFLDLISDPATRIAVVGNASSGLGQAKGAEIDAHDVVIRFNVFDLSEPYQNDYGTKTDIILTTESVLPKIDRAYLDQARMVVLTRNLAIYSDARVATPRGDVSYDRFAILPDADRVQLFSQLGIGASAGLKLLTLIHRLRGGTLQGVSTYGFAFTPPDAEGSAHYFEAHRSTQRHNWPVEKALFDALIHRA